MKTILSLRVHGNKIRREEAVINRQSLLPLRRMFPWRHAYDANAGVFGRAWRGREDGGIEGPEVEAVYDERQFILLEAALKGRMPETERERRLSGTSRKGKPRRDGRWSERRDRCS
jgi:hypothetical protein